MKWCDGENVGESERCLVDLIFFVDDGEVVVRVDGFEVW